MKKLSLVSAAVAMTAIGAQADWVLSDYSVLAPDSLSAATTYGLQTFGNPASKVGVTVPAAGSFLFKATLASDGTAGYTANVGVLHALTPDWAETDLTGLKAITFQYKNSALITDALSVSFGSGAYSEKIANAGTVYENAIKGASNLGAHTSWATATLDTADFATPSWWTAPVDFPTKPVVLKKVKNLQFAPKSAYTLGGTASDGTACKNCVGPSMTAINLEIRNVTLVGIDKINWPNPGNIGCETATPFTLFDNFVDGESQSELGGYWYVFNDSGDAAKATDVADKAKGSSKISVAYTPGDASVSGFAEVTAKLNKKLGTTYHPYAGWAALGVGFEGDGLATNMDKLTAIQFLIKGNSISPNIEAINFKVSAKGISDTATHFVALPAAAITAAAEGKSACIRPEDLKQASYLVPTHKSDIVPADIQKMAWEAKIADQSLTLLAGKDTATANFWVTDVKLFGSAAITSGVRNRKSVTTGFSVQSGEGVLNLSGYQGIKSFDVVSVEGKKITSFAPAATVAISLPRGSYFLVGKRDGASVTKSFAVVR